MREAPDLSNVIYGQDYIRYDRMYAMTMHAFSGQPEGNSDLVNIFVDVNSMLRFIYSTMPYQIGDYTCITASMVNLCAHLKAYFWTRHLTYTKIYLVYGDNNPQIPGRIPFGYNGHYLTAVEAKKELQPLIESSMDLLNILLPYIRDCYFVRGRNVETAAIIYDMIKILEPSVGHYGPIPNIVYTKDTFCYQLVSLCHRTFIYRPKKSATMDVSWDVTKTTLMRQYRQQHDLAVRDDLSESIPFYMLPFLMAMGGLRGRDIRGPMNITQAMKTLVENPRTSANEHITTLLTLGEEVPSFWDSLGCGHIAEQLTANLRAINLLGHVQDLRSRDHQVMYQNITDLHDPEGFKEINNKYFINYPLDVERL